MKYRPDIDGLRAVAVLAVVAFHSGFIAGGFVGVDVFFVISGYLITGIIVNAIDAGTFSFAAFYARRVRRIFPALILVLIATLATTRTLLLPDEYDQLVQHAFAGALFASNFLLLSEAGYFDIESSAKPLLHLWSLSVEEQFYLVWPAIMLFVCRFGRRRLTLAAMALVSFALCLALPLSAFYLPFTRFWQLIAGALLLGVTVRPQLAWAGLAMILASCVYELSPYPGWWAIVPTAGAALVIAAGSSVLSNRALVYVGRISYPLYLWHWPLIFIARSMGESPLLGAAFAFPAAMLTYRLIEGPLRLGRLRLVAGGLAAMMIVLAGALAWAMRDEPLPSSLIAPSPVRIACLDKYPYKEAKKFTFWFCRLSHPTEPTVIVLGDSHANHLFPGLVSAAPEQTILSIGTCQPVVGIDQDFGAKNKGHPCTRDRADRQEEFIEAIVKRTPSIRYAVLSAKWRSFDGQGNEVGFGDRRRVSTFRPSNPKERGTPLEQYLAALGRKLQTLQGQSVAIVLDNPRLPYHPRLCGVSENCITTLAYQMDRQAAFRAGLARLLAAYPSVTLVDPVQVFCTFQCDMTGMLLDEDHLTPEASARLGGVIADQLFGKVPAWTSSHTNAGPLLPDRAESSRRYIAHVGKFESGDNDAPRPVDANSREVRSRCERLRGVRI